MPKNRVYRIQASPLVSTSAQDTFVVSDGVERFVVSTKDVASVGNDLRAVFVEAKKQSQYVEFDDITTHVRSPIR